jgi:hypothetical protein
MIILSDEEFQAEVEALGSRIIFCAENYELALKLQGQAEILSYILEKCYKKEKENAINNR